MISLKKTVATLLAAAAAVAPSAPALAGPNLIANGSFSMPANSYGEISHTNNPGSAPAYSGVNLSNWTSGGYNFLFKAANADSTSGVSGQFGNVAIWGNTNQLHGNGFSASPDGGNFVGLDAQNNYAGKLSQTLTGLTVGQAYDVSFYWAAAQQYGFDGHTGDSLTVGFGTATQPVGSLSIDSHGFSGWKAVNLVFTADATTDTLSFLAGSSNTPPPFVLLDGVSVSAVPEPASMVLVGLGVIGLGLSRLARRRKAETA